MPQRHVFDKFLKRWAPKVSEFLEGLRALVTQADCVSHGAEAVSRIPIEERQKRIAGPESPNAAAFLQEMQQVAVQVYKFLAKCCQAEAEEERARTVGAIGLAFQHEALIVLTDKEWAKPKRLKSHEAFWDVHPDLASSKAAKLALKNRFQDDDLKAFFVDAVGIPESLTQQDLEARLRVPLSHQAQESSWQDGLGLGDFEEIATVRRGPGVLGGTEGDELFEPANLPDAAGGASSTAPELA
ncbi:unnamed protein product [Effrenium voratum]|nr:unnamed protein product [Effrenium voratum]